MVSYVITSNIGSEHAFAALVNHVLSFKEFIVSRNDLMNSDFVEKFILSHSDATEILIFGDFSIDNDALQKNFPNVSVKITDFNLPFSTFVNENNVTDIDHRLIDMLDQRCSGKNTEGTQALVTGISNILPEESSFQKYLKLFNGQLQLDDILQVGNTIIPFQKLLVADRVKRNSRTGYFKNGLKYAVTQSPELINMAHDELKRVYPDIDVSMICNLTFSANDNFIAQSLRSYRDDIDVRLEFVNQYNGGGSQNAAGCQVPIDIKIDY